MAFLPVIGSIVGGFLAGRGGSRQASAPPPPQPVDPAKSALDYTRGMMRLQPELLAAEQQFRPQYTLLNLQDAATNLFGGRLGGTAAQPMQSPSAPIYGGSGGAFNPGFSPQIGQTIIGGQIPTMSGGYDGMFADGAGDPSLSDPMFGGPGGFAGQTGAAMGPQQTAPIGATQTGEGQFVPGALDLTAEASRFMELLRQDITRQQRQADIADVEELGPRASEAFMAANPELRAQLERTEAMQGGGDTTGIQGLRSQLLGDGAMTTPGQGEQMLLNQLQQGGADSTGISMLRDRLQQGAGTDSTVTNRLRSQAERLAGSAGQLTDFERQSLEQQARAASLARGRELDSSSIANEMTARFEAQQGRRDRDLQLAAGLNQQLLGAEGQLLQGMGALGGLESQQRGQQMQGAATLGGLEAQRRGQTIGGLGSLGSLEQSQQAQDRQFGLNLIGARSGIASDPFQAILGRPATALGMGTGQTQYAQSLIGQASPQLFNPDAGINLALANNANLADYQSNVFGAQSAMRGNVIGGGLSALGQIGAALPWGNIFGP